MMTVVWLRSTMMTADVWRASFHGSDVKDFVRINDNAVKTSCTRELGLISQYIALLVC